MNSDGVGDETAPAPFCIAARVLRKVLVEPY